MMDKKRIEAAVREILAAVGADPDREGLVETPARVARMYEEIFSGLEDDPKRHVKLFNEEKNEEMVIVRDIPMYSMCEHHLLPFIGRAGRLLDEALDEAGLKREDVFITSIIKCRPPQNRKPKKKEIELCLPYLEDQMDAIRPRIICLMGNTAIQAVLGVVGVTVLRGRILSDRFLVTYHPAAVLRNRNLMADFVSDLREAKIQSLKLSKDAFAE